MTYKIHSHANKIEHDRKRERREKKKTTRRQSIWLLPQKERRAQPNQQPRSQSKRTTMMEPTAETMVPKLLITFRGSKIELPLLPETTVMALKECIVHQQYDPELLLAVDDIKLMLRGKVLKQDTENLYDTLVIQQQQAKKKPQKVYQIMATGLSKKETTQAEQDLREGLQAAPRIRDDLTTKGRKEMEQRKRLGRQVMLETAARNHTVAGTTDSSANNYGFGKIETLPNLPQREQAQRILETLANDPGIRACMAKHKWKVGSLAELYPEGKVGKSQVCVMGLNQNKGMRILLRVRTDDLQGFRKMLSIRKVLFHELAHNVHSEHDGKFFQLMRQIEAECNSMDWTQGAGLTDGSTDHGADHDYKGGIFRLGGNESQASGLSHRELAAQAAMKRMTVEEEEIQNNCGCGRKDLFLPPKKDDPMDQS